MEVLKNNQFNRLKLDDKEMDLPTLFGNWFANVIYVKTSKYNFSLEKLFSLLIFESHNHWLVKVLFMLVGPSLTSQ